LIDKRDSRFSRLLDVLVTIVTFGRQREFSTRYVTTIGRTIYFPAGWAQRSADDRYIVLRHEAVHLRQFRSYGLLGMSALYLLPVLPLGLAWGRARLEWAGYRETLRATAEVYGVVAAQDERLRAHIVRQFTSGAYGWMWPFPRQIERWIDDAIEEIRLERLGAQE
jgi:hypothetical protein